MRSLPPALSPLSGWLAQEQHKLDWFVRSTLGFKEFQHPRSVFLDLFDYFRNRNGPFGPLKFDYYMLPGGLAILDIEPGPSFPLRSNLHLHH